MTDNDIISFFITNKNKINNNLIRHIDNYKEYKDYLLNRYNDNETVYRNIIWRIYIGQDERNKCPICHNFTPYNPNKKDWTVNKSIYKKYCCSSCAAKSEERNIKYKSTNLQRYGVPNILMDKKVHNKAITNAQSVQSKQKRQETIYDKYGVQHLFQSNIIRNKIYNTNLLKYKTIYPIQSNIIKDKIKQYNINKYNTEWFVLTDEFKEKSKQTCINNYGVDNYFKTNLNIKYTHSKYIINKINETKRKNHTFNVSKPEDECYELLCSKFGIENIKRQHKTSLYPYCCDFYVSNLDLYIECNFHWTHGPHLYNKNNIRDIILKCKWNQKAKKSKFYFNAIKTWTIRDTEKQETANQNKLNWISFYSKDEFFNYFHQKIDEI